MEIKTKNKLKVRTMLKKLVEIDSNYKVYITKN